MMDEFVLQSRVAYFSMEIALREEIPTYAGGLGMLAGDTIRSAADLSLPMVAVSLVYQADHFRQEIDANGGQIEQPMQWDPAKWATLVDARIAVRIEGRAVWVGAWLYVVDGRLGDRQIVLLLDTNFPENTPQDRSITHELYGGDSLYRLKQEIVLGIGGVRLLHALGFDIRQYHMNEGHSALLGIELLKRFRYHRDDLRGDEPRYDLPRVRELCCFTTHTPIAAGHDRFPYDLIQQVLYHTQASGSASESVVDLSVLKLLGGESELNMTQLALNLSEYVNGVAVRHAEVSRVLFPGYRVHAVTNGVHPSTWTSEPFATLYDRYIPDWRHEPERLSRADSLIPDDMLWDAHLQAKKALIDTVQAQVGISLRHDIPIIGFARRMTGYKRPDLIFQDMERLKAIARQRPFQLVFAGKAHPRDEEGKRLIEMLHADARALSGAITVAYLPNYDMALAKILIAGCDVWLNTPLPPLEASGTSGMKAAFNGVPSLSVLDGWWIEGCIEGVTGWAIGTRDEPASTDAAALYDKLEHVVLPLYYRYNDATHELIEIMKGVISKNASYFNSHRMMRRYATEAYQR
jgi:glycogen phosphorylase